MRALLELGTQQRGDALHELATRDVARMRRRDAHDVREAAHEAIQRVDARGGDRSARS